MVICGDNPQSSISIACVNITFIIFYSNLSGSGDTGVPEWSLPADEVWRE